MPIIFFIIAFIIVDKIIKSRYTRNWNKGLDVIVKFESDVIDEGKKGRITEIFSNDKKMTIPMASVKFELDKSITYSDKEGVSVTDKQYRSDAMTLRGRRSYKKNFEVLFNKRGVYNITDPVVSTRDWLCVYNYSAKYEQTSEIYVFPSYSKYVNIIAPFSRAIGEAIKNKFLYEDPFEFKGIRDYTGAEPMKKINWSASAKTGELKVNNYYDTSSRHATLFLDICNDQIWRQDDQLEECIRITRNYMEGFIRNHIPLEIITNAKDVFTKQQIVFDKGQDAAYVDQCLRKMSRIDLNEKTDKLSEYFLSNEADADELCVLLSVDQSEGMKKAFEQYLGDNEGEWICPTRTERLIHSGKIHVTYVEVGR